MNDSETLSIAGQQMSRPRWRASGTRQHVGPAHGLFASTLILSLVACTGGGSERDSASGPLTPAENGSYLYVSAPDFYFGTRDVGTVATQEIELVNRGADIYPVRRVSVSGADAEEFSTELFDGLTLNPAESVTLNVQFSPISDGRKFAQLDIDFDIIKQVDESVNQHEQTYYSAKSLEQSGEYRASLDEYGRYLDGEAVTINRRRAAIRVPVIEEIDLRGDGADVTGYLKALDARDRQRHEEALIELELVSTLYPDSHLADDARYLSAYIHLMDLDEPAMALKHLTELRRRWPDSSYYDSALYSEGLAQQALGNHEIARSIYEDLRYRHTGVDALGITLAKDSIVSRLWFERAEQALATL